MRQVRVAPFSEAQAMQVEVRVMRLPERPRTALRLHYVVYKQMPLQQKCRILSCSQDEYPAVVARAAKLI